MSQNVAPAVSAPATSGVAYLNINVPADAKLYLQDQLMTVEGAQRRFVTPLIQAGDEHLYTVKVEVVRDGKTITKTAQTTVSAGTEAVVTLPSKARTAPRPGRSPATEHDFTPAGANRRAWVILRLLVVTEKRRDPSSRGFSRSDRSKVGDPDVSSRSNASDGRTETPAAHRGTRMRVLRWAVNCWLVFHLSAIIIAPASVAPTSELIESTWQVFQPYLEFLFLNHGYHFFAPEPAESTLISFEAERADGTKVTGHIPSRKTLPRLLYHRHFMLTEHLHDAQLRDAPDELLQEWLDSYAEHICRKYGAVRVKLTGHLHGLPSREDVRRRHQIERSGKL